MSREFLIHNGRLTSDLDADGNLIKNLPGVAHLVDGKVPSDELPSYVDDVLEYATRSSFPATGERGKIYIALDTNKTYRWSGTQYTEIASPTLDDAVTKDGANGVKSSGIWSALWGALTALPTGFSSLYDWVVGQLAGKMPSTATGADIAVSGTDATKINAALDDKLDKSGGTASNLLIELGTIDNTDYAIKLGLYNGTRAFMIYQRSAGTSSYMSVGAVLFPNIAGAITTIAKTAASPTAGNLAALDENGNPTDSGVKASDKLDSTSAAPAFSSSSTYAVDEHCTYNGKLYRCTTAVTTAGAWTGSTNWTAEDMTTPDAVLDITAQNQLRVVAKDGTLLWAQGYDLASTSSATLVCDAVNNFTFADGATSQAFTLPTSPSGKAGDFGLDIDNYANTGAATLTLTGLDSTFSVVVPEGESLNDMLAIAAGELARFYVTLTTFRVNNLPTWHIVKQVVENGGATA